MQRIESSWSVMPARVIIENEDYRSNALKVVLAS